MTRQIRILSLVVASIVLPIAAGACADDGDNESAATTTTPEERTCDAWRDVVTAFEAYDEVDVVNQGLDSARTYLDELGSAVSELADAASSQLEPAVVDLQTALGDLRDAAQNDAGGTELLSAADRVDAAWDGLVDAARADCPEVDAPAEAG